MNLVISSRKLLVLAACLVGSALACQAVLPPPPEDTPLATTAAPTGVETQTPAPPGSTEPAPPTQTIPYPEPYPEPLSACPGPVQGSTIYTSEALGFCFRFPSYFTPTVVTESGYEVIWLQGPREPAQPKSMERVSVSLQITLTGPALGLDSQAYAARWQELFGGSEPVSTQQYLLGGLPALVSDNAIGMVPSRMVFVVANGMKYNLNLSPQPGAFPVLDEHVQRVWDEVSTSIVFIPPTGGRDFIASEEVCLPEEPGTHAYKNDKDGYCLLYPDDFQPDRGFPGSLVGGPILGDHMGFENVQTSLTVGTFGDFPGQAIRDVMAGRLEFSDTPSIQDTTVAGYPAITYRHLAGPWATRDADVSVNGRVFTILAQPWEPVLWPQGIPFLDRVWDTVIRSIRFYDPWR